MCRIFFASRFDSSQHLFSPYSIWTINSAQLCNDASLINKRVVCNAKQQANKLTFTRSAKSSLSSQFVYSSQKR
ncbi:MAG: hypothetical protein COB69_09745 [Phycisphaera sp.]|nr:MAG: hypothetical protein COB69_09745 [Phycisphaera sp.]